MCDDHPPAPGRVPRPALSRRSALASPVVAASLLAAPLHRVSPLTAVRVAPGAPPIVPRSSWGGDLAPKGPIPAEDVRFLLVHHTLEPGSDYEADEVPRLLRGIYDFHTGSQKKWPDLAYNFFVDRFGTIYEGRTGSLAGPVAGSATGGNQGFSQLCCFLGDFTAAPPPAPALDAMFGLLAWLADRYGVDTQPGATVSFVSRGSNRWPAGADVVAPTIAGHRQMSQTECPGDACFRLVGDTFPEMVTARRTGVAAATSSTTTTAAPSTTAPSTTSAPTATTTVPSSNAATVTASEGADDRAAGVTVVGNDVVGPDARWLLGAGAVGLGAAAFVGWRARRTREVAVTATELDPGASSHSGDSGRRG